MTIPDAQKSFATSDPDHTLQIYDFVGRKKVISGKKQFGYQTPKIDKIFPMTSSDTKKSLAKKKWSISNPVFT